MRREMDGGAGAGRRSVSSSFGSRAVSASNAGRPARPQPAGRPSQPSAVAGPQAGPRGHPGRSPAGTQADRQPHPAARPPTHPGRPAATFFQVAAAAVLVDGVGIGSELDWNRIEHHIYAAGTVRDRYMMVVASISGRRHGEGRPSLCAIGDAAETHVPKYICSWWFEFS